VIDTRRPNVVETGLILGKDPTWSRITFRSIRIVETRAVLALFEDLTNERKQFLAVERQKQVVSEANASLKQEVARRKRVEGMLRKSLDEKELLLREAHHRVNNNLQIMSSLLRLQASKTSEAEQKAALKEAGDRIHSMALVFEKLYRSERVSKLNLKAYVSGLVNYLVQSYDPVGQRVRVLLDVKDMEIDVEIGAILGLALCELLSNALKHAFPDNREGRIYLKLMNVGQGRLELVVEDDGVGLPKGVDSHSGSLGLSLVGSLARQLGGSLDIQGGKGARFRLEFNSEAQRPPSVNKI
jgi:two-component sensor histidine kinase